MPLLPFLLFVIINSFTPGPNNFMAMSFASRYGFKKTLRFCLGVGLGFFTLILLCSSFNDLLIKIMPTIKTPLTILGVSYMLYLAFITIRDKETKNNNKENNAGSNFIVMGFFLQFVNPKGILFGITVVSTFILPYYQSYFIYFICSLFLGGIGIVSSTIWSLFGNVFQKFLPKYRKVFNIVMASLLVYSAIAIINH
ncbi:LysE family translocator [Ornithinibacillus sp. 179-J 7C1 HS]|uniref:LysE family translocator n=1 Tax=Ornithinibacillus sp. 179-J 7C1 HS TaxID=3142384 RepID=UPI0039A1887A